MVSVGDIEDAMSSIATMIDGMEACAQARIDESDWRGAADAMADIRCLEARLAVLEWVLDGP